MAHAREHSPVDSSVASDAHEVQPVASPLVHVKHEASQATHLRSASSANLPAGHSDTQAPLSEYLVPAVGQVRQEELLEAEHVSHDSWQDAQIPAVPTTLEKRSGGHSLTHVPSSKKGAAEVVQLWQSVALGPLQVPHEPSQGKQTLLAFANLPSGVHEDTQLPGALKNGDVEAQVLHSPLPGP